MPQRGDMTSGEKALALATKRAVEAAGGIERCVEETPVGRSQISRFCSVNDVDSITIASAPARVLSAPKLVDEFYSSAAWRALVADRKLDPDYIQAKARAKRGERLILDHVDERRDGGADLDPANTQWLTFSEHQVKTAKARARRAQGRGTPPGQKL